MIYDQKRIDAIRRRVIAKLEMLRQIDSQTDDEFRSQLKHPRNRLIDIDKTLTDLSWRSRTPEDESHWLDGVEKFLRMAEHACQFWEDEFAKRTREASTNAANKDANTARPGNP
jgi:hypothetical protein